MARVNLDGKVWKDPRVKRLARRRKWSVRETIGTLAAVWDVAYDNKTPIMPKIDVDTAAESDGFAADMVAEDLATEIADSLLDVRLRGVTDRIQYLITQAERGRLGGIAKAARGKADGAFVADAKQPAGECQAPAYHAGALPPDPDLPPAPPPTLVLVPGPDREARSARPLRARGSRIVPTDWQPRPEDALLPPAQLATELAKFRDHQFRDAKTNWDGTWKNWQRTALERSRGVATPPNRTEPHPPSAYPEGRIEL